MLSHVTATRYVTPLREGGSLPGVMEADDLGIYVVKFSGAGQGRKVLVAEVIGAGIARALGLPVPELVTVDVDAALGKSEPDQEVQELLLASPGLNLGMDFLPGCLDFDSSFGPVEESFAAQVLWFDALIGNVDRSWRNPNMLVWHGRPYLIDHGSALTFHHNWPTAEAAIRRAYSCDDHVMSKFAAGLDVVDATFTPKLTDEVLRAVVADVPETWLDDEPGFSGTEAVREAYVNWLSERLAARESWLSGVRQSVAAGPPPAAARGSQAPDWLRGFGSGAGR